MLTTGADPAPRTAGPTQETVVEDALRNAIAASEDTPPKLAAAVFDAVFPGGGRIRPQLCLGVASACGLCLKPETEDDAGTARLALAAAVAVELLHCASLVLDDLPCFDAAELRRGRPSVHKAHGESLAVLAGAALIVRAFEVLAATPGADPERRARLIATVSASVGMRGGICAGQALEFEDNVDLSQYHQAKTGALFAGAVTAGAIAAGHEPAHWQAFACRLGEAYQVLDDLRDVAGSEAMIGKPEG
ncbi:MAG: polyprenyl synthetase family protein, partial [Pseudomonadota bacterium]